MNVDFPEESDSSDEDYVPTGAGEGGELPSEDNSDGKTDEAKSDPENSTGKGKKRKKRYSKKKKKIKGGAVQEESSESTEGSPVKKELTEEERKQRADALWADFGFDTALKKKSSSSAEKAAPTDKPSSATTANKTEAKAAPETVKVTQIFEFAGEKVEIEKEVARDSAEARLLTAASGSAKPASGSVKPAPSRGRGRGGLGGIGSVLNQIGKKQKLSTLEKSKLDWNKFKKQEEIEDELENYKKGKDGYLDKQDFLERADHRRFEIERDIRNIERNKRLNNVQ